MLLILVFMRGYVGAVRIGGTGNPSHTADLSDAAVAGASIARPRECGGYRRAIRESPLQKTYGIIVGATLAVARVGASAGG